jgi:aldose 1-epimerase
VRELEQIPGLFVTAVILSAGARRQAVLSLYTLTGRMFGFTPRSLLALMLAALALVPRAATAQTRYDVSRVGDVVTLSDQQAAVDVRVLTTASNAYQMTVKGEDVIRKTWNTLDEIRARMGLNGVPLLWPYANRLDEQAFYANGKKYSFDVGLGNTGTNPIPIHGFLTTADAWKLVEAKADAKSAWVTMKLDFFRIPRYMKQFPFAHTLTMTYRVEDGALEVRTRIDSLSDEPIPVAIGFHPYFQLTDSPREQWRLSVAAKTHWLLDPNKIPTGQTQPITAILPNPKNVVVKDVTLDDIFTDLERDANGRATMTLIGKTQQLDVVVGLKFKTILVLSRDNNANRPPPAARGTVAFEPMAAVSNGLNLAQKGLYKDLQSIEPGGSWEESFWIRPRGF